MNILDIDFGNTRLKWRILGDSKELGQGVLVAGQEAGWAVALSRQIADLPEPDRIRVSSVRDRSTNAVLDSLAQERWSLVPEYARVSAKCAGVINAYSDVSRMGVDRWLAMLAGFNAVQDACMIIDAGSALTVDIIAGSGLHEGGYIVPGMAWMLDSLRQKSEALQCGNPGNWNSTSPGSTTSSAIENGLLSLTSGWLASLVRNYSDYQCLITGGDAQQLMPFIGEAKLVPSLVMNGLDLALP